MQWKQPDTTGAQPSKRLNCTGVVVGSFLWLFGGYDGRKRMNDLFTLDMASMRWARPVISGGPPSPRYGHTMTALQDKIIIHGGATGIEESDDLFILDTGKLKWQNVKPESRCVPICHHNSIIYQNYLLTHGGAGQEKRKKKITHIYALDLNMLDELRNLSFEEARRDIKKHFDELTNSMSEYFEPLNQSEEELQLGIKPPVVEELRTQVEDLLGKMKTHLQRLMKEQMKISTEINKEWERLSFERERFETEKEKMRIHNETQKNMVVINVGGQKFATSIATLTAVPNSMLNAMFSGRYPIIENEDKSLFIDRDGTHFRYILNYLRDGSVELPEDMQTLRELSREADFYQLTGLEKDIIRHITEKQRYLRLRSDPPQTSYSPPAF